MIKRVLTGLMILVAAAVVAAGGWYYYALQAPGGDANARITIQPGASTKHIATELKQKNLIRSALAFELYVKKHGLAKNFKSGRYSFSATQPAGDIAKSLTEGPKTGDQFTIKEGKTQAEIAKYLTDQDITNQQEFASLKAKDFQYDFLREVPDNALLEGFLFPETYTVPAPGTSAADVASIMLNQFGTELTPELRAQIKQNGRTLYETVIIASIVEAEVRTDADRKLVAGVIYRRLREGIRLDADATVRYGLKKPTGALTKDDLNSDNPYNTRRIKGLPPGPIGNPGLSSLKAAIYPQESEYLFYLSAPDGKTIFSKTLEEHEANVEKYLR